MKFYLLHTLLIIPHEFIWLSIALFFTLLELSTPGLFYFLSFAFGAVIAAATAYLETSIITQCATGLFGSVATLIFLFYAVKKNQFSKIIFEKHQTNNDALIGQTALVVKPVGPNLRGMIKIRGELWPAQTVGTQIFYEHTIVEITHIKGNTAFVKTEGK